jgi:hypothetical protein
MALAPDFLEARIRFAGQAFAPGGREQALALTRGMLGLAGAAAIGSMLFGDKKHGDMGGWSWKEPFSMTVGDKKYAIRSVPGDIFHLMSNPRNFVYWRLNPTTIRAAVEMTTGRDIYGRRRSFPQQLGDFFVAHTPIPLQPLTPSIAREQSLLSGMLRMVGISSQKYKTPADQAMMDYFMEYRIDRPATSELVALQKSRRKVLELARAGNQTDAVKEIRRISGEYKLDPHKALDWLMEAQYPENLANFRRLPPEVQAKVIQLAEPAEEKVFIPAMLDKIGRATPEKVAAAMPEVRKYIEMLKERRKRSGAVVQSPQVQTQQQPVR